MEVFQKEKNTLDSFGFSLPETIIASALFLLLAVALFQGFTVSFNALQITKLRTTAALLANEQIELVRNLPYKDVGIVGGVPKGVLPFSQDFFRGNATFTVETYVRNIDDPFDGQIGSTTNNDYASADYKLVEFVIKCPLCKNFIDQTFTTTAAPKNLETTGGNGALFVQVFNANGIPVSGATVIVKNNATSPPITITDVTNTQGFLQLVDIPPGFQVYEASSTKTGFSIDKTYKPGLSGNPNPAKPHATIASGTVTQLSFAIDVLAGATFRTRTNACAAVPGMSFHLKSSKQTGVNPDVFKYSATNTTNGGGNFTLSNMEWDTYTLTPVVGAYQLAGSVPFLPLAINPGSTNDILLVYEANNPNALLVSVKDGGTGLPLSDASVTISATSTGYNSTLSTSRGYFRQTNWAGGGGQSTFLDTTRYFNSDGNVDVVSPAGDIKLASILGLFAENAWVESSTFDAGATTTSYYTVDWNPQSTPPEAGAEAVRFQVATNNDKTTWNYIGPDGTSGSYYTLANNVLDASHNNSRYLRYKLFLQTASSSFTPTVSDISFTYSSECLPFGQVFFNGLGTGTYTVSVSKGGYQPFSQDISIANTWQTYNVTLIPE